MSLVSESKREIVLSHELKLDDIPSDYGIVGDLSSVQVKVVYSGIDGQLDKIQADLMETKLDLSKVHAGSFNPNEPVNLPVSFMPNQILPPRAKLVDWEPKEVELTLEKYKELTLKVEPVIICNDIEDGYKIVVEAIPPEIEVRGLPSAGGLYELELAGKIKTRPERFFFKDLKRSMEENPSGFLVREMEPRFEANSVTPLWSYHNKIRATVRLEKSKKGRTPKGSSSTPAASSKPPNTATAAENPPCPRTKTYRHSEVILSGEFYSVNMDYKVLSRPKITLVADSCESLESFMRSRCGTRDPQLVAVPPRQKILQEGPYTINVKHRMCDDLQYAVSAGLISVTMSSSTAKLQFYNNESYASTATSTTSGPNFDPTPPKGVSNPLPKDPDPSAGGTSGGGSPPGGAGAASNPSAPPGENE